MLRIIKKVEKYVVTGDDFLTVFQLEMMYSVLRKHKTKRSTETHQISYRRFSPIKGFT